MGDEDSPIVIVHKGFFWGYIWAPIRCDGRQPTEYARFNGFCDCLGDYRWLHYVGKEYTTGAKQGYVPPYWILNLLTADWELAALMGLFPSKMNLTIHSGPFSYVCRSHW